jgi:predicted nuclease of predicted toxin-antitoxin system
LLLDEMYPAAQADALRAVGIEASTAAELGLAGSFDAELFAAALAGGYVLLTENVADFARIAADHLTAGQTTPAC